MGMMGQNSGPDECAFVQIGDPNFANILGLNEETRRNQNWELDRLQNLQVFYSLAHKILN